MDGKGSVDPMSRQGRTVGSHCRIHIALLKITGAGIGSSGAAIGS